MRNTNLKYRHQEVLGEGIFETTSLGFANCCPVSTEDMQGRYIILVSCLTSVYVKMARKMNLENYLNITTMIKVSVTELLSSRLLFSIHLLVNW